MTHFSHYALQGIIREKLIADTGLMSKVTGVFDFVPEKTAYPYLTIGESRAEDESTVAISITRIMLTIQIYSRAKGRKEVDAVMASIHAILDGLAEEAAEDFTLAEMRYTGSEITLLRDGVTYNGRMRFTARLQRENS